MRTILLVAFLLAFVLQISAQRECATQLYTDVQRSSGAAIAKSIDDAELFIQNQKSYSAINSRLAGINTIRIPVVVHVLYNNASQNISEAQINSQIDALNRDFRKLNPDTINIPQRFKEFAADVQIEFVLATGDAKGRKTNGIVRKYTGVKDWKMDDKIKFSALGGSDAWDRDSYLNIWVGNTRNLLGYSSAPGGPAEKDGIVINFTAFGTMNVNGPYHLGRTAVHEVGHWLGLKHIWGDTHCGDDMVEDTPKQGGFTAGCPTGFRTTCSNAPLGDMYMNYMDFTNDACVNLFTEGQKERMRSLFSAGGPRSFLLSSKGLNEPWSDEIREEEENITVVPVFKFFPNPAMDKINFKIVDENWIGKEIRILNVTGAVVQRAIISNKSQTINVSTLPKGIYFLQAENGTDKIAERFIKL